MANVGVDSYISKDMQELIDEMKRKFEKETGKRITQVQASSMLARITKSSITKTKPVINLYTKKKNRIKQDLYNEQSIPNFF